MKPLERRLRELETVMVKPAPVESIILSSLEPDFEQRLSDAQEAGLFVVVLSPLTPLAKEGQHEDQ